MKATKLKGMTFNHNFGYSFPLFSSLLKKWEEEKKNELAKIVIMFFSPVTLKYINVNHYIIMLLILFHCYIRQRIISMVMVLLCISISYMYIGTVLSEAMRKPYTVAGQTNLLWKADNSIGRLL